MTSLCAPILAAESADPGRAYYVDPRGRDENPGTRPELAWRTIARANRHEFRPGDRLLFAGGKVFQGNLVLGARQGGTSDRPVIIGSYGPGRASIKAGLGTAVLVKDSGGVEVRDLVCIGSGATTNHGAGVAFVNTLPGNVRLNFVRIRNVEAHGYGCDIKPAAGDAGGFQPPAGCGIFVGGAPRDHSKSGFADILIDNCDAHDNEFYGALISGTWHQNPDRYANTALVVAACRFHGNPGDPEYRDNHSGSGILVEDTDGALVERCAAWENGALCNKGPGGPCGIWTAGSRRVIIQHCESFRNRTGTSPDGDGFDLDGGSIDCLVQYNYSHDNDGAGILVYTYAGAPLADRGNIVRFNVCENDAVKLPRYGAIYVGNDGHGMSGIEVYNNTLIAGRSADAAVNLHGTNIGVAFRNNLILARAGGALVKMDQHADTIVFQGNLYWARGGPFATAGPKRCASLAAWRQIGKEMLGPTATGLFADPGLRLDRPHGSPGKPDRLDNLARLRPPSGSPAIGVGLDLKRLFKLDPGRRDVLGAAIPFGKALDVGAVGHENRAE
jgi:hypothetical protein